jgi:hypothetical protein
MNNFEISNLDKNSLMEVNGGSEYSYESGVWAGEAIHKWLIAVGILRLIL